MKNSTSTDATFTGTWYSGMVVKHYSCHSTAPADINKQSNKWYAKPPPNHPLKTKYETSIDFLFIGARVQQNCYKIVGYYSTAPVHKKK